jgi:excinuclease UvrABC ATPase subunit
MKNRRPTTAARTTIAVQGARVHNLKNISLEIPRDRLIVIRLRSRMSTSYSASRR